MISLVVLFMWQKSHYYTLLVICLDIFSRDELIWFCLLWCVLLHAFRVYWYAFVSRSEGASVCMLYNCEWNSPAFLVRFCVLMSLQASCPIFSYLEQHCVHVLWLHISQDQTTAKLSGSAGLVLLLSVALPVYLLCCLSVKSLSLPLSTGFRGAGWGAVAVRHNGSHSCETQKPDGLSLFQQWRGMTKKHERF